MCDHRLINSVKKKMVDRRHFLKTSSFIAAGLGLGGLTNSCKNPELEKRTVGFSKVLDMTHTLTEDFPTFSGERQFFLKNLFNWEVHNYNINEIRVHEHTGTHLDAPLHFSESGQAVEEIPITNLVVPLAVVDIRAKAAQNPDAQLTPDDVEKWIQNYGNLPQNSCLAMHSGWGKYVQTEQFRNADEKGIMHFPGIHVETVEMLLEETSVVGIAVDTLSLDYGQSQDFASHYAWLPRNKWGLECIANLESVQPKGSILVVGAPKHKGGSGGPCRVMSLPLD